MKRRDTLKALSLSSLGMAVLPTTDLVAAPPEPKPFKTTPARIPEEIERDKKIMADKFLTASELATIAILVDIIIPADSKSGSATQAGVPAFIEFIVKDMPQYQTPIRGGLKWLDNQSGKRFGKTFALITPAQRIEIIEDIAYPDDVKPEFSQGASFFSQIRNLTVTGFYTTRMGFDDLGYMGNTPNEWKGVPQDVLDKYGLKYDPLYDKQD
ncbi:gluconate 2-dehydrogenase subunit 3 family protein [Emticicia sp. 21SJ11W-3]|uniref:gluconate 2-dehydrogenase subunit 3 family protein n=1 Tax=Emticicia sp. 21SJ11W-3 TaxID=2916755 RepID=UPI00209DD596|nr:gluconate 2-dehydrogenase subunit 3 family protein [Emticicia sp. 21SJ11W-3]UTA67957.1 gluconate 2-dehydrogenase subunit 3 family protein [Emticicia sp. 21SJ11W-3]